MVVIIFVMIFVKVASRTLDFISIRRNFPVIKDFIFIISVLNENIFFLTKLLILQRKDVYFEV